MFTFALFLLAYFVIALIFGSLAILMDVDHFQDTDDATWFALGWPLTLPLIILELVFKQIKKVK